MKHTKFDFIGVIEAIIRHYCETSLPKYCLISLRKDMRRVACIAGLTLNSQVCLDVGTLYTS